MALSVVIGGGTAYQLLRLHGRIQSPVWGISGSGYQSGKRQRMSNQPREDLVSDQPSEDLVRAYMALQECLFSSFGFALLVGC